MTPDVSVKGSPFTPHSPEYASPDIPSAVYSGYWSAVFELGEDRSV